ncbi:HAD-like domain [Pseudocohnilembus persalinus]|uniref:HAD-like domain n=1 Tax=Pseudocohnilembus persalinus TaxID=266149 RepID=A0A0V0QTP5_PSEPJ|nr:HAD-like domain [Pseudocohnilembus persalinus]|eukprot:KRX05620.1 HAD-like domain [Pseudocohnilembus persalinus]
MEQIQYNKDVQTSQKLKKNLFIFDFDHTIIEDNSDTTIFDLIDDKEKIKQMYKQVPDKSWTLFVNRVLDYMFTDLKIDATRLMEFQQSNRILLTQGMEQLLKYITDDQGSNDAIIVSDSNTYYIQWILQKFNINNIFNGIYTNQGYIDENKLLKITPYHQHMCQECPSNLCKQQVVQEYLENQQKNHQTDYENIYYIGDGGNDFCPLKLLQNKPGSVFVRKGFALEKKIPQIKEYLNEEQILVWQDGLEILEHIQQKQAKLEKQ